MNQALDLQFHDEYPENFWNWLKQNQHVYRAFTVKALAMAMTGRKVYGAKTIVEVLRYDTDVSDSEKTFKLNNNYTSGMARLWMTEYGDRFPRFFRLRNSQGLDE